MSASKEDTGFHTHDSAASSSANLARSSARYAKHQRFQRFSVVEATPARSPHASGESMPRGCMQRSREGNSRGGILDGWPDGWTDCNLVPAPRGVTRAPRVGVGSPRSSRRAGVVLPPSLWAPAARAAGVERLASEAAGAGARPMPAIPGSRGTWSTRSGCGDGRQGGRAPCPAPGRRIG